MRYLRNWTYILLGTFIIIIQSEGLCDDHRLVALRTVKARPLSMGGAFLTMTDDLASLDFNPATFSLSAFQRRSQLAIFINPLGPVIIGENWSQKPDWDVVLGWMLHGFAISVDNLTFGFLIGEESFTDLNRLEKNSLFDGAEYHRNRNTSIGISFALAPRVSLGIAGEGFIREAGGSKVWDWGYRYGIRLKPRNSITVGLCFFDLPNDYAADRMTIERFADETLNIGISYSPWETLTLALDVRNVSDEDKGVVREPHMGFEFTPIPQFSFRGGYYQEKGGENKIISLGAEFSTKSRQSTRDRFFMNPELSMQTTFIWEKTKLTDHKWILLSCVLRI